MIYESVWFRIGSCHVYHTASERHHFCLLYWVYVLDFRLLMYEFCEWIYSFTSKNYSLCHFLLKPRIHNHCTQHLTSYENPRDSSMHIYFIILIVGWICGCISIRGCFINANLLLYYLLKMKEALFLRVHQTNIHVDTRYYMIIIALPPPHYPEIMRRYVWQFAVYLFVCATPPPAHSHL